MGGAGVVVVVLLSGVLHVVGFFWLFSVVVVVWLGSGFVRDDFWLVSERVVCECWWNMVEVGEPDTGDDDDDDDDDGSCCGGIGASWL